MSTKQPSSPGGGDHPRVAIVVSRYNDSITGPMREGAMRAFASSGGRSEDLVVIEAPGAFELPAISAAAATTGRFDAIVALGCVIRGETSHDRHIASAVADGLTRISVETGIPVAFGVLTVDTVEQARARAGGAKGNKGEEAMHAALGAAQAIHRLDTDPEARQISCDVTPVDKTHGAGPSVHHPRTPSGGGA